MDASYRYDMCVYVWHVGGCGMGPAHIDVGCGCGMGPAYLVLQFHNLVSIWSQLWLNLMV